jgi:hypothetical protein
MIGAVAVARSRIEPWGGNVMGIRRRLSVVGGVVMFALVGATTAAAEDLVAYQPVDEVG